MTKPTIARAAGMLALALSLAALALPAAASGPKPHLSISVGSGSGFYDDYDPFHGDCLSRQEIRYEFAQEGLRHIDVKRTHDYGLYLVSGYLPAKEAAILRETDMSAKPIRYVYLFDSCSDRIVKQLQPKKMLEMM